MNKTIVKLAVLSGTMALLWCVMIFVLSKVSTPHFWSSIPVMLISFIVASLLSIRINTSLRTAVPVVVESALIAVVATITCYFSFLYFTPYVTGSMLMTSELMIMVSQAAHDIEALSRGLIFKSIACVTGVMFFVIYFLLKRISTEYEY